MEIIRKYATRRRSLCRSLRRRLLQSGYSRPPRLRALLGRVGLVPRPSGSMRTLLIDGLAVQTVPAILVKDLFTRISPRMCLRPSSNRVRAPQPNPSQLLRLFQSSKSVPRHRSKTQVYPSTSRMKHSIIRQRHPRLRGVSLTDSTCLIGVADLPCSERISP